MLTISVMLTTALIQLPTAGAAPVPPPPAQATQLSFSTQPGGAQGGVVFSAQPVVAFKDAMGQPVSSSSTVALTIKAGTGAAGASLTCPAVAAVNGTAAFAGCSIDKAGPGYMLVATAAGLAATSAAFDVGTGPVVSARFVTQPPSGVAGVPFSPAVGVFDAGGNIVLGSTATVVIATASEFDQGAMECPLPAVLLAADIQPAYTMAVTNGIAVFKECTIDKASSTVYRLVAIASNGPADEDRPSATSEPFTIRNGSAGQLVFTTGPVDAVPGSPLQPQPVVAIQDTSGNVITTFQGEVSLSITAGTGPDSATLACAPVLAVDGVATFGGCEIDTVGTGYQLTASAAGLTAASTEFDVGAGDAALIGFARQPSDGTGGVALGTQPVVRVADSSESPVSASVALTLIGGTAGATLSCPNNPASAGSGIASFTGCSVDRAGTGYQLVATANTTPALVATSAPFDVTAGAAARIQFVTSPSGASGGTAFLGQPAVIVSDLGGNPLVLPAADFRLALTAGTGPSGAALTCGEPTVDAGGRAAFSGCLIDKIGVGYRLTVSARGLTSSSGVFAVTAGGPARLIFRVQPSGGIVNSPFGSQPQVVVVDAGGNQLNPVTTLVTLRASSGTVGCHTNPVSTTTGMAVFTGCQVDKTGTLTLTANASGLPAIVSDQFTVVDGAPLGLAPVGLAQTQSFGAALYSRNTTSVVDHVNTATGALQLSYTDLTVAGIGMPFELTRQYNSGDTTRGSFGLGWSSIFDAGVTVDARGKTAIVRGEDGQRLLFTLDAPGRWIGPAGAKAELVCRRLDCTVTRSDGVLFRSTIDGRIQDYLTRDGHGLRFGYQTGALNSVTVERGDKPFVVSVARNAAGQVTKVSTPTRSVNYSYGGGALTGFVDAGGNSWAYAYGPQLTQVVDPTGHVRLSVSYGNGRVVKASQLGSKDHFVDSYSWDAVAQLSTRVSHGVGSSTGAASYVDQYKGNVLVYQQFPSGGSMAYSYDQQLNLLTVKDPLNRLQQFAYNGGGDLVKQDNPLSATASTSTKVTYDSNHRPLTLTDPNGNTTRYQYSFGDQSVTQPGQGFAATWYRHNYLGLLTEISSPTNSQRFTYDNAGNQTGFQLLDLAGTSVNGRGPITTYDESGNELTSVDARGNGATGVNTAYLTNNSYDAIGNLLSSVTPVGTASTTYTAAGDIATMTDAAGKQTSFGWDESTLTATATGPNGTVTSIFDSAGNLLNRIDAGQRSTLSTYDNAGRQTSSTDPANITTTYTYDLLGNVLATSDTVGHASTFQYDAQNRPVRSTVDGATTSTGYDASGNVIAQTDAGGNTTAYSVTARHQVAAVTDAAGTTSYQYDLAGNQTAVVDGVGQVTNYRYNAANQKSAMIVDGQTWSYGYDAVNNLISSTDPDGRIVDYTLSAANLPTRISYSQPGRDAITITQGFNAAGQRVRMTDPTTGDHTYSYDDAGNLTKADNGPDNVFSYDYSAPGQVSQTYPDGTAMTYSYDDAHNLMALNSPGINVSYLRDPARRITGIAYSNGIVQTQTHDQTGRVVGQALGCGGVTAATFATVYDGSGNPTGQSSTVGPTTTVTHYGYDGASRVAAESVAAVPAEQPTSTGSCTTGVQSAVGSPRGNDNSGGTDNYVAPTTANQPIIVQGQVPDSGPARNPISYDAIGNRTASQGTQSRYGASGQLLSQTGVDPASYTYDKAGNLTGKIAGGVTTTYSYDAASRLVQVVNGTSTISYGYDGDNNRVSSSTVDGSGTSVDRYSWDINAGVPLLALERDGNNALIRRYFYGVGPVVLQTATGTYYQHTDQQNNVTALSDQTGAIVESYSYTAFGSVTRTTVGSNLVPDNPLLFQGQYLDTDTGLYNMRARNYDPAIGRFTQRDPLQQRIGTPAVSAYVFAANRPTVSGDPTGLMPSYSHGANYAGHLAGQIRDNSAVDYVANSADALLHGHSTESANDVQSVGYGVAAAKFLVGRYVASVGGELLGGTPGAAGVGVGRFLAVAGVALALYVTVEDCKHGPVAKCVADTVGVAFSIGCMAISSGAGAFVCSLAGMAISAVIARYGPEISAALRQSVAVSVKEIASGVKWVGSEIAGGFDTGLGAAATGFNKAASAISSGYNSAVSTLEQAGYTAVQLANVLAGTFAQGIDEVVNQLASLAYDVNGVAAALFDTFGQIDREAAAILLRFDYGIDQVAGGLKSAYHEADLAAALVLQGLGVAVADITQALKSVYQDGEQAAATVLKGLNYTIDEIAQGLQMTFQVTDVVMTTVLRNLNYGLDQVAGILSNFYTYVDPEKQIAEAFALAQESATAIAGALRDQFQLIDVEVARLFNGIDSLQGEIATALQGAYGDTAAQVASALKTIGATAGDIAAALTDVFDLTTDAVAGILQAAGFTTALINDIGGAFSSIGQGASAAISWIKSLF